MASEQEIIRALDQAGDPKVRIRIIDQLGHKIKPQHRELIRYLVDLSRKHSDQDLSYSVKRALFQIRSRYNITNFPLFLMDPVSLIQSSDPAYRLKALEIFENKNVTSEQCYFFLGSIYFEDDPFVLSKMLKVLPKIQSHLPANKLEWILKDFLESPESRVRANALEAISLLEKSRGEAEHHLLFNCLKDSDQRVRANAIAQILKDRPGDLEDRVIEILKKSQNYYEILSAKELSHRAGFEVLESVLTYAQKRLQKLEKEVEEEEVAPQVHLGLDVDPEENTPLNWSMLSSIKKGLLILPAVLTLFLGIFVGSKLFSQKSHDPALQKENTKLKQALSSANDRLSEQEKILKQAKEDGAILVAKGSLSLEEKIEKFKKDGKILKQNADIFFNTARIRFSEQEYAKAITLYKALYDVYKDNRLAVDSVRMLSKTQKVQNVLASVRDYLSKNQFISAHKKLDEIKHLVDAATFKKHKDDIDNARKEHQGMK